MDKIATLSDGKTVGLRATALTPRKYRHHFNRDLISDLQKLAKKLSAVFDEEQFEAFDLELFENISWIMAKDFDKENVPDTPDEWLEGFDMFSIYEVLPTLIDLWRLNNVQTSIPKKN